jgi:hypothetical protein
VNASDVTAVIVTRGDVDLQPILDSLIFDKIEIYNNSVEQDEMTYGRVLAAMRAETEVVYSQDDDILHSPENQQKILNAYTSSRLVGCMWDEWSEGARRQGIDNGYDDLVFPGSGSICRTALWVDALERYLSVYPRDDFFRMWSDTIIGVITPTLQLDLRFDELPWGDNENRMAHMEDAVHLKTEAIQRARGIRVAA